MGVHKEIDVVKKDVKTEPKPPPPPPNGKEDGSSRREVIEIRLPRLIGKPHEWTERNFDR